MPTVISAAGQQASISIGNSNDTMLSLGLRADPVAEDGGYDLSLDFQRQEQQSGFGFSRSGEMNAAKAADASP